MGVKISELQEKTSTNDTDVLPIVDATGGTKKITVSNLLKALTESISNINGTVLYNNSSGTSADITFTNNITTYKRLMIEYFDESSKSICISNVPVVLNNFHEGTGNNYLFVAKIKLESNKLVWNNNSRYFLNSGTSETNRKMFISKITGYTY